MRTLLVYRAQHKERARLITWPRCGSPYAGTFPVLGCPFTSKVQLHQPPSAVLVGHDQNAP